jgi:hypothetical protein
VDVSLHHVDATARPWRTAALVAATVAAVELIVLVVVGGALIAKPAAAAHRAPVSHARTHRANSTNQARIRIPGAAPAAARLPRAKVSVLVLNGNGRRGAAATTAALVAHRGYRIGGVANAPRSDFTRSLVMYRKGFEGEGRRLAHDLGIRIVGPLDGMRTSQLHGAKAVVVVGA